MTKFFSSDVGVSADDPLWACCADAVQLFCLFFNPCAWTLDEPRKRKLVPPFAVSFNMGPGVDIAQDEALIQGIDLTNLVTIRKSKEAKIEVKPLHDFLIKCLVSGGP